VRIYSYTESDIEDLATDAGQKMIAWLWSEGYLTDEQFDELQDARPVFLFRSVAWYTRLWKKLWPQANADTRALMVARLPNFKERWDETHQQTDAD